MMELYPLRIFFISGVLSILNRSQAKDFVCQIIQENNYTCETHLIHTLDGYMITVHRIPLKFPQHRRSRKIPFLLFHGLIGSAADFVLPGKNLGLGCILHEQGYDVWLPNARGTTYSKQHAHMNSSSVSFWNFSWHEIGYYDLSAIIDYIIEVTGHKQLHYIGHSQGATVFFALLSERSDYNRYISTATLLAPVAYLGNLQSPPIRLMARNSDKIEALLNHLGLHELFPSTALNQLGGHLLCGKDMPIQNLCLLATFFLLGFSDYRIDRNLFPRIFETTPAGISRKQLQHYGQLINSGKFQKFNYGSPKENQRFYNNKSPPEYKFQNIGVPLQLFYGNRDFLVTKKDVIKLTKSLKNASYELHEINGFNHIDFLYSYAAPQLLTQKILDFSNQH